MNLHAKNKGNIGEMAIAKDLMLQGYSIFYELGDNSKIDLIALKEEKLIKIQVKAYTSKKGECVEVKGYKYGPNYKFKYKAKDIDVFAIYVLDLDKFFYLKSDFLNKQNTITIRFKKTKNGQHTKCNFYTNYQNFENSIK